MADDEPEVDYYRAQAAKMRKLADAAPTDVIRDAYLDLALNWEQLADRIERSRLH